MDNPPRAKLPTYLTTKEVAALLRVKERKVYDLAGENEIPHRRITGKLLFPETELMAWMKGGAPDPVADRPPVVAGSHDPLLDWAIRESGCGLATLFNGSSDGLTCFVDNRAVASGLHLPSEGDWNIPAVATVDPENAVLIGWARRRRGLLVRDPAVSCLADLAGNRVVRRQAGAGADALLMRLLAEAGMTTGDLAAPATLARTEADAAAMVAAGEADAALGLEAMARAHGLSFAMLVEEAYDLLIDRRAYFAAPFQTLMAFAKSAVFVARAETFGGYGLAPLGSVRWVGR